jgi:hypothetical protein
MGWPAIEIPAKLLTTLLSYHIEFVLHRVVVITYEGPVNKVLRPFHLGNWGVFS